MIYFGGYLWLGDDYVFVVILCALCGLLLVFVVGFELLRFGEFVWVDDAFYVGVQMILFVFVLLLFWLGLLRFGWCLVLNVVFESIVVLLVWIFVGLVGDIIMFVGCGEGFILVGDDVFVGYAVWWCELIFVRVVDCCLLIGLVYLCCVECGELFELVVWVVAVIRVGDVEAVRWWVWVLLRWGASSGVAMFWGVVGVL